jgi:hypothetical protein
VAVKVIFFELGRSSQEVRDSRRTADGSDEAATGKL